MESKLAATDKEADKARKMSRDAREEFNRVKKKRCGGAGGGEGGSTLTFGVRTDRFNKAYQHISETIDAVYKDLTKGPNAPLGGVAYLSLEDSEVGLLIYDRDACVSDKRLPRNRI